jgi:hypothetical protein
MPMDTEMRVRLDCNHTEKQVRGCYKIQMGCQLYCLTCILLWFASGLSGSAPMLKSNGPPPL